MTIVSLLAGVVTAALPTLSSAIGGIILLGVNPYLIARSVRRGCVDFDQARLVTAVSVAGFVVAPILLDMFRSGAYIAGGRRGRRSAAGIFARRQRRLMRLSTWPRVRGPPLKEFASLLPTERGRADGGKLIGSALNQPRTNLYTEHRVAEWRQSAGYSGEA